MNLERLKYIMPLDVDIITFNFMALYLEYCQDDVPEPELMVAWTAGQMGEYTWMDSEHFMYNWLLQQAMTAIADWKENKNAQASEKAD